jgi:ergothioneine biosynthesis protein EgtB
LDDIDITANQLALEFQQLRQRTLDFAGPLSEADMTIQAAEFASPGKWHLAHTTWFFEEFVLQVVEGYQSYGEAYRYLFNSYYESVGARHGQAVRGLITRPGLAEVLAYRKAVDEAMLLLLEHGVSAEMQAIVLLGMQHEQQHQELFLTDILYNLAANPLHPAYHEQVTEVPANTELALQMVAFAGGLRQIGHEGEGFGFDNEFPQHAEYLQPYRLANRLVTNGEWLDFIADGGYTNPLLWLSDGWKTVQAERWRAPLYWQKQDDSYHSMTLAGLRPLDLQAPVTHISYFEADAYARWAGKRLPTEAEWETAAAQQEISGNFAESGHYRPRPAHKSAHNGAGLAQIYGDAWEWTASPYIAYPGFRPGRGAIGEYNGKFMNNQYVLRGGSCVTPQSHIRASYRNFFYPHQRWQFTGLRLAEDAA